MKQFHFFLFTLLLGFSACVDDEFDVPPVDGEDPGLTANYTIAELKALSAPDDLVTIEEDLIIKGTIIADDRAGNFFRTFYLQDETAGMEILINLADAYVYYPVGRELYIKLQGLVVGQYAGNAQLGGYIFEEDGGRELGRIIDLTAHLFEGQRGVDIVPVPKSISELNDSDLGSLVTLADVEFAQNDTGQPFADAIGRTSLNRTLVDCDGNEIVIRTSGFADFASELTPDGLGTVTGVYTQFFGTQQLLIRGVSDIDFEDKNCGEGNPEDYISIADLRDLFANGTVVGPANKHIVGTVISDAANANVQSRNLFLQDDSGAGIVVRFASAHSFMLGDVLDVRFGGEEISEFNGLLQINNLPNAKAVKTGTAAQPAPVTVTVAELLNNGEAYESTLVFIEDVTITNSGGNTFDFITTVTDATGSITMFTTSFSTFANETLPDEPVDMTAIVSQGGNNSERQLVIRNLDDLDGYDGGGGGGGNDDPVDELMEDFQGGADGTDVNLSGWTNVATEGTRLWRFREFDGNVYVQATAFNDSSPSMETWLVTPPINMDEASELSFESFQAFYAHNGLTVLVSTDYDGDNVQTATWQELDVTLAGSGEDNYTFVPSGSVDLGDYDGTGYIAFRYNGNGNNGNTTTYAIDNIVIE